jgi:hypothetical protein
MRRLTSTCNDVGLASPPAGPGPAVHPHARGDDDVGLASPPAGPGPAVHPHARGDNSEVAPAMAASFGPTAMLRNAWILQFHNGYFDARHPPRDPKEHDFGAHRLHILRDTLLATHSCQEGDGMTATLRFLGSAVSATGVLRLWT